MKSQLKEQLNPRILNVMDALNLANFYEAKQLLEQPNGRSHFLRQPNFGKVTLKELEYIIANDPVIKESMKQSRIQQLNDTIKNLDKTKADLQREINKLLEV